MALPTLQDCKNYLRIQTSAEDSVVTELLAEAKSWAEALIGKRITAASTVMESLWATRDSQLRSVIQLPFYPVSATGLVLKDGDGETVDEAEYTVNEDEGILVSADDFWFANPFYEVTADVGLSAGTSYANREPRLRMLIIQLTAILYKQRNPNASSDSGGGGVSVSYQTQDALPPHLNSVVESFRARRVA